MPKSLNPILDPVGLYDPTLRFAFTNITQEDFHSAWDKSPITVPAGDTIELPQYLAVKLTGELVDKIMIGNIKLDESTYYKNSPSALPNTYRAASQLGVPAARKVWEDQIVRQLAVDEESPQIQVIRAQIKSELLADISREKSTEPVPVPTSLSEFSELSNDKGSTVPEPEKKPLKVKQIK